MTTEGFADDGTILKDLAQFDLAQEMKDCEQKKPWPMGHFAKTLFKKSDFRMVLIVMDKGAVLKEHHADGTISVQILKGSIDFRVHGESHGLQANYPGSQVPILSLVESVQVRQGKFLNQLSQKKHQILYG